MSKCMTIDEAIDQKDTFSEVTPKGIVDSVLEEILISVLTVSDKGCNRIGDFNINEDFCQQYNQPLKDFEQTSVNQTSSAANIYSGKNKERPGNRNENPGVDWLGKTEEKVKPTGECKVISEEILADNELQIQNGQIHLERIKRSMDATREEYYQKEDVIKDKKIEIEYYTQGKLNKIYVPLNEPSKDCNVHQQNDFKCEEVCKKETEKKNTKNENESSFKPFTTEDLRQVWTNGNSSLVGKWNGDVAGQREEVVKLMEGLSNIQVFPDGSVDPNRPRTCSVAEEDVKKMIKEIEEISFIQGQDNAEDYPPDGQGDADLESKSFTKSRDMSIRSKTESRQNADNISEDLKQSQEEEIYSSEVPFTVKKSSVDDALASEETASGRTFEPPRQLSSSPKSLALESQSTSSEEQILGTSQEDDTSVTENVSAAETFIFDLEPGYAQNVEEVTESANFFASGSIHLLESRDRLFTGRAEAVNSRPIIGIDTSAEMMVAAPECTAELMPSSNSSQGFADCVIPSKPDFLKSEKVPNTRFWPSNVTESSFARTDKVFTSNENSQNEEINEEQPTENGPTESLPQRGGSCSQNFETSEESMAEMKESESLQSQDSATYSETQSQEIDSKRSEPGKFKLHSEKMYSRMGYDPAGFMHKKYVPSESEEAFVEEVESVLQIIEPQENSQDEGSPSITFSLLSRAASESFDKPSAPYEVEVESESHLNVDVGNRDQFSDEIPAKKVYSGMTTIGPMKNVDYDPKDLSVPDIDFGKMTRITSSRQLAKDFSLLGADITTTAGVKILEKDDSDESIVASDNDGLETSSLVNRDIASLTKVQKIREVMSYQPKPEEDFEDEQALPKPRLDLKDVESLTDERYKAPEVNIPLLSFEVMSDSIGTNAEAEKQLIESMGLIISGLTEPYYEDARENNENNEEENNGFEIVECEKTKVEEKTEDELQKETSEKTLDVSCDNTEARDETQSKHATLSNVIKKASSMFVKKENDVVLRNSKSLPRDTSKITTTDSIRSILDDCSTSASNVLKKSRSMLRNTQSLFKTISQNRMNTDGGLEGQKMSPSESDVTTVERKLSFPRKEDFTKAKNLIKSKVEKTFKKQDSSSELESEKPQVQEEKKELQVALRNEEKLRVDRMENFKKWLPKTPMVYKSQFVKSQITINNKTLEADLNNKKGDDVNGGSESVTAVFENESVNEEGVFVEETAKEIEATQPVLQQSQTENGQELTIEEGLDVLKQETHPDYIVMETIQGLPTSDLESPSSEKENIEINVTCRAYEKGSDEQVSKTEMQAVKEAEFDIVPYVSEVEDDKMPSKSERKMVTKKKKKLSARLRSFWCSTFGRVKTPLKKSDVS